MLPEDAIDTANGIYHSMKAMETEPITDPIFNNYHAITFLGACMIHAIGELTYSLTDPDDQYSLSSRLKDIVNAIDRFPAP